MAAPALFKFKTHTATGAKFWASVHYLGRRIDSTPRLDTRAEAQAFARIIIRQTREKMNARAAELDAVYQKTRRTMEANAKGGR